MIRRTGFAAAIIISVSVLARPASAQTAPRVLIDAGAAAVGGGSLGSTDASYITPAGTPFTLFSSSQSWSMGAGVIGHLLVRVAPRVQVEVAGSWTAPQLRSKITSDFENIPETTASQTLSQFLTTGGVVVSIRPRGPWTPFVRGAAGWMRHLSRDQTLYQDGVTVDLGGGVRYAWREKRGHVKPYGVRADVWLNVRRGGIEAAPRSRLITPALSVAFIFKM